MPRRRQLWWGVAAVAMVPACGGNAGTIATTSTSPAPATTTTTVAAPSPTPAPRTDRWVALAVGDCIADVPQVELGEIEVTIVDCATPHKAEVFSRAAVSVNAAVDDVAAQACGAALPGYAGDGGTFAVTYLIDSNQDRTTIDPSDQYVPSTVICLLQEANGDGSLTGSARR